MSPSIIDVQPMIDWLHGRVPPPPRSPEEALAHLCRGLVACGLPLYRVGVFVRTLHPNVAGRAFFWREDREEVEVDSADYGWFRTEEHLKSPIHAVWTTNAETRRHLADPACPMLAGQIKRGDGQDIEAVIWFCDLRDSTPLADSMSRREFLHLLNEYFECVLGPVLERRGEVLRFIGDAALAIFPVEGGPASACAQALAAAREALERMDKLNEKRSPRLRCGIGLHLGSLTYGNVGTPSRIEFTVIGAAANEAARIESLCKTLEVDIVVSERVAKVLPDAFRPLGSHTLRGVGDKMRVFTPLP